MKQGKFTVEQIIKILKENEAGVKVVDLCRKYGFSDATYYNWKSKYDGMEYNCLCRKASLAFGQKIDFLEIVF